MEITVLFSAVALLNDSSVSIANGRVIEKTQFGL